jgi:Adenylate and Guanylate cyclase catalytic domain
MRYSQYTGMPLDPTYCPMTIKVYPSTTMEAQFTTNNPMLLAIGTLLIFLFTSTLFLLYDYMVERRQKKLMNRAVRSSAIVSSLFPAVVRDRIYPLTATESTPAATKSTAADDSTSKNNDIRKSMFNLVDTTTRLLSFLIAEGTDDDNVATPASQSLTSPIAELFPDTTVLFADIAGFTAWSSVREPTQVFTLLETLYAAFDSIARRRGVFKVETIGDSYVAVCGLPEPRQDHAVVMARFARDCRDRMVELTRELETTLGPDTGDLALRIGLNSGPVTAGVLRGERAR